MIGNSRFLAVIPARGGSKSVHYKNIKNLAGVPLLTYAIDAARKAGVFDRIVVSTDDEKIVSVAEKLACDVIRRPENLATDEAKTEDAVLHALSVLEAEDIPAFDYVAILEPTSPFRRPETVAAGCRLIIEKKAPSLISVAEITSTVGILTNGMFDPLIKNQPRRRQERRPVYTEAGVVYAAETEFLKRTGSLVTEDWLAHIVPNEEALDINSPEDFNLAEQIMAVKSDSS